MLFQANVKNSEKDEERGERREEDINFSIYWIDYNEFDSLTTIQTKQKKYYILCHFKQMLK